MSVPTAVLKYEVRVEGGNRVGGEIGLNSFLSKWASDLERMSYLLRPPIPSSRGDVTLPVTEDPAETAERIPSLYRRAVDDLRSLEEREFSIWKLDRYQLVFPRPPGTTSLEDRISREAARLRSAVQAIHLLLGVDLRSEIADMTFNPVDMVWEDVMFSFSRSGRVLTWRRAGGQRSKGVEDILSSEEEALRAVLSVADPSALGTGGRSYLLT